MKNSRPHFKHIKMLHKCKRSKKGFEMSFSVIFSIIAGAIILSLAIYATIKFINIGQETTYVEAAKEIDNSLGDLVTGIAEGVSTKITFRKETRVLFNCSPPPEDINSPFGKQTIGFSEQSGIGQEWYESKTKITRKNKYVFANNTEQGKKMFIFIKPFYMGFKVDDLIIMSSSNYCFVTSGTPYPSRIIEDLRNLQMENIQFAGSVDECGAGNITVCFNSYGCNINIDSPSRLGYDDYEIGSVEKNREYFNYVGNLLYGAIFSSKEIYSCNLDRLGKKTATLAELYLGKISVVPSSCSSAIGSDLSTLMDAFNAGNIINKYGTAKSMDNTNALANCKIYPGESYGNV